MYYTIREYLKHAVNRFSLVSKMARDVRKFEEEEWKGVHGYRTRWTVEINFRDHKIVKRESKLKERIA